MKRIGWSKVVATRISVRIAVLVLITVAFRSTATAQNPVPLINQPLVPATMSPGAPGFTLTAAQRAFVNIREHVMVSQPFTTTSHRTASKKFAHPDIGPGLFKYCSTIASAVL